jgi:hypothetical protein
MMQSASVPRLGGPDAMIPDKDEVGGFKPSHAHQVMLPGWIAAWVTEHRLRPGAAR